MFEVLSCRESDDVAGRGMIHDGDTLAAAEKQCVQTCLESGGLVVSVADAA